MKEPSGNLDFIKPFENQKSLTDAEKMEAAYKMSALVDDLLLRFADSVSVRSLLIQMAAMESRRRLN